MAVQPPSRSTDPEFGTDLAPWFWATVAGIVLTVWLVPAIPSQDGPSHLYNLTLIAELLGDAPTRANVHTLDFDTITNLGFVAVALPLAKAMPLWAVERFVVSLHVVLIAWFASTWLAQTGRRPFPLAWIGVAFSFPWALFMGFYAFMLGADIALLSLCLAWRQREAALPGLVGLCAGCGALVLLFHAVAAALFAGLAALIQLTRPRLSPLRRIVRASAIALPVCAMVLLATAAAGDSSGAAHWQAAEYVLVMLMSFGMLSFSSQVWTCLVVGLGVAFLCLPGIAPRARDHAARFSFCAVVALTLLHVGLPDRFGGGGYLTGRFAWWIPLLALPLFETSAAFAGRIERARIPFVLAFVSLGSTVIGAAPDARLVAEVSEAARSHQTSGVIATAIFDRSPKSESMIEPLRHVSSLFVRDRGVLMTNYQARVAYFPLRFTDAAKARFPHVDINAAWETDWARLPISDLLSIDANDEDRRKLSRGFERVWTSERNRVELWRKR